jgi:hypothetical protein
LVILGPLRFGTLAQVVAGGSERRREDGAERGCFLCQSEDVGRVSSHEVSAPDYVKPVNGLVALFKDNSELGDELGRGAG